MHLRIPSALLVLSCVLAPIQALPASAAPRLVAWVNAGAAPDVWLGGGFFPGKGWRSDVAAKSALFPGTQWQLFSLSGPGPRVTSGAVLPPDVPEGVAASLRGRISIAKPMIAVSGASEKAQPRLPRIQSTNQPLYQRVAAELLRARGLKTQRVRLTQLLRVDLNGDGVEEVLMSARSRDEFGRTPQVRAGDYSLTGLRFVVNGEVKNLPLSCDVALKNVEFAAPFYSEIMVCVDVDGDGRMEIVTESGYYEGWGFEVWRFDGKSVSRVLNAGWGV